SGTTSRSTYSQLTTKPPHNPPMTAPLSGSRKAMASGSGLIGPTRLSLKSLSGLRIASRKAGSGLSSTSMLGIFFMFWIPFPRIAARCSPGMTASRSLRCDHVLWFDHGIEFLRRDIAALDRFFFQGRAVLMRGLGDLGGGVIADLGRQRRHQHQRSFQSRLDIVAARLNPHHAIIGEADRRIGH